MFDNTKHLQMSLSKKGSEVWDNSTNALCEYWKAESMYGEVKG